MSDGREFYYKDGNITQLISGEELEPEFIKYCFQSNFFKEQYTMMSAGSTLMALTIEKIKELYVLLPSKDEQKLIINYLNDKIKTVDELISNKQVLIQLLEEKRQSMITEAVTKGLNPNVKMKDSGVEWIGEIPEYWNLTILSRVAEVIDPEPSHRAPAFAKGEGFPYVGIRDINSDGTVNIETARPIEEESLIEQEQRFAIEPSDIVFCRVATLGLPKILKTDKRIALSATLALIKSKKSIDNLYLLYYLKSDVIKVQTALYATGSTRKSLGMETIRKFSLIFPPLGEQKEISRYLNVKINAIDENVLFIERQIEKLKEYRQSLIYEAVTGKIDVRDFEVKA
ncbi:restriction endonuclease subunit S [Bacillus pacificus]